MNCDLYGFYLLKYLECNNKLLYLPIMNNLKILHLCNNNIVSSVSHLRNLEKLSMSGNAKCKSLNSLHKLTYLQLGINVKLEFSDVCQLTNLIELNISKDFKNHINLSVLRKLKILRISNNNLNLDGLKELEYLNIGINGMKQINNIKLTGLVIHQHVSQVSHLTNLIALNIGSNKCRLYLDRLSNLKYLYISRENKNILDARNTKAKIIYVSQHQHWKYDHIPKKLLYQLDTGYVFDARDPEYNKIIRVPLRKPYILSEIKNSSSSSSSNASDSFDNSSDSSYNSSDSSDNSYDE